MDIIIAAGSSMSPAEAGKVTLFINTEDDNILSYIDENGVIKRYNAGDARIAECCSCDIAKQWAEKVTCALNSGMITADAFGTLMATGMTVTSTDEEDEDGKRTCTVSISQNVVNPLSIDIVEATLAVAADATGQLTKAILPATAPQGIVWVSSDVTKATVSQTGLVTGIAAGTATITAYSAANPNLYDTCVVTVS